MLGIDSKPGIHRQRYALYSFSFNMRECDNACVEGACRHCLHMLQALGHGAPLIIVEPKADQAASSGNCTRVAAACRHGQHVLQAFWHGTLLVIRLFLPYIGHSTTRKHRTFNFRPSQSSFAGSTYAVSPIVPIKKCIFSFSFMFSIYMLMINCNTKLIIMMIKCIY